MFLTLPVFSQDIENAENYLVGITVSKSFANNYEIRLQLKNPTEKGFKLQELGNSSYAMMLPQVKSLIDEQDILYEDEPDDIKIVISENKDLIDKNKFYTKLNFKTKDDRLIHVEAFATKSLKSQVLIKKTPEEIEKAKDKSMEDWIWYIPVGILSLICIFLIFKPTEGQDFDKLSGSPDFPDEHDYKISTEKLFPWTHKKGFSFKKKKIASLQDFIRKNIINKKSSKVVKTNDIIDELVKVILPENDLILMPGVPELPGLENKETKEQNTKVGFKDEKIDLFDAENTENKHKIPVIPSDMTLAERLKAKDLMNEADDIILSEKEIFFTNIFPISDIPEQANELHSSDENDEENTENEETEEISKEQIEYEKLLAQFEKVLTVAHKIRKSDYEETFELEILDSFAISDTTGFSLAKLGNKVSLLGYIKHNVFIIKTFDENEVKDETLFMEFCTQTPFSATYSVILNKFKALVKITESDISLIGEYA